MSSNTLDYLLSPKAIRDRAQQILKLSQEGKGQFNINMDKMDGTVNYVIDVIKNNYPDLKIPYHSRWSHFQVGGVDRLKDLSEKVDKEDELELARTKFDLVIVSVLLDAGAGNWQYNEAGTNRILSRSEGLAVASFHMFLQGMFSSEMDVNPYQADGPGMLHLTEEKLKEAFQVTVGNPLIGVEGRLQLIHSLGKAVERQNQFFKGPGSLKRPGYLVDYFLSKHPDKKMKASFILKTILESLGTIWPGRITLDEVNLGDVWKSSLLEDKGDSENLVPFHKLSQWMIYYFC